VTSVFKISQEYFSFPSKEPRLNHKKFEISRSSFQILVCLIIQSRFFYLEGQPKFFRQERKKDSWLTLKIRKNLDWLIRRTRIWTELIQERRLVKVGENGQIRSVYDTDTKWYVFLRQIMRYDTDQKRAVYTLYTTVNTPFLRH
jgi:hypothetical protein